MTLQKSNEILLKASFVPLAVCQRGAHTAVRACQRLGSAAGAAEQPFMNEAPEEGGGYFSYNNSLLLGFIHSLQSQCN